MCLCARGNLDDLTGHSLINRAILFQSLRFAGADDRLELGEARLGRLDRAVFLEAVSVRGVFGPVVGAGRFCQAWGRWVACLYDRWAPPLAWPLALPLVCAFAVLHLGSSSLVVRDDLVRVGVHRLLGGSLRGDGVPRGTQRPSSSSSAAPAAAAAAAPPAAAPAPAPAARTSTVDAVDLALLRLSTHALLDIGRVGAALDLGDLLLERGDAVLAANDVADDLAVLLLVVPRDDALAVERAVAVVDGLAAEVGLVLELGYAELLDEQLALLEDFGILALGLAPLARHLLVLLGERHVVVPGALPALLVLSLRVLPLFGLDELEFGRVVAAHVGEQTLLGHNVKILGLLGELDLATHHGVEHGTQQLPDAREDPGRVVDVERAERFRGSRPRDT
ncbi:hypothetical protein L1887_56902 [Cichorium endivia]|nr:hypothetical protein L1887_56902 [Cichorium endivia]